MHFGSILLLVLTPRYDKNFSRGTMRSPWETRQCHKLCKHDDNAASQSSETCFAHFPPVISWWHLRGAGQHAESLPQGTRLIYTYLQRSITLNIVCGSQDTSAPEPVDIGGSVVDMTWRTPVVCTGSQWGMAVLITSAVFLTLCASPALDRVFHCALLPNAFLVMRRR